MGYTNSSLATYTKLSPRCNTYGARNQNITFFTPHCVVGQCTIETLGSIFANPERGASSNYGIDKDGRIGLFVNESDAAGTSSSRWNDERAITVECASDNYYPYAFREVVFDKLVDLLVDCCKRNGKNKVLYLGSLNATKNYNPKPNEMIITLHRWFTATACPGDWMYNRVNELVNRANAAFNVNPTVYNGVDYAAVYSPQFYRAKYPDLQNVFGNDLNKYIQHFATHGIYEGRQAKEDFCVWAYKHIYPDLQAVYGNDISQYYIHYMKFGKDESRTAKISYFEHVFNAEYYSNKYPDLKKAYNGDPNLLMMHFTNNGMKEARQASAEFNVKVYMENYKDLRDAYGKDIPKYYMHYIKFGYNEHREAVKPLNR